MAALKFNRENENLKVVKSNSITFVEQFQIDEYRKDCRRIIVRNYKILYYIKDSEIFVIRVFNTLQDPTKSL